MTQYAIQLASFLILSYVACGESNNTPSSPLKDANHFGATNRSIQNLVDLRKNVEDQPKVVLHHQRLAQSYLRLGYYDSSLKSIKNALVIHPKNAALYDILGALHLTQAFAQAKYAETDSALGETWIDMNPSNDGPGWKDLGLDDEI